MATGTGTGKGGYDCKFVTHPPKSLECPVCLLTLRDPHVISCCGNEFCQVCIQRVQRDGKPCPLCNEANFTTFLHKKLVREVNALMIYCPHKELGCEWKGELGRLQQHLNPGAGGEMRSSTEGCGFVIVTCSYQCGAELSRNQIHEHELDVCPRRPVDRQIASLVRKLEAVVIDNQVLRQELNEMKQTHQKELERMKQVHVQELQLCRQDLQMHQTHTIPLPVPPFYFTMYNFKHLKNYRWFSDPFYTHPGGYKMVVSVYPDGFDGNGAHLSVFVQIRRGEFDDQLQWPFNGEVTIQTFNRKTDQWSQSVTIELRKSCVDEDVIKKPPRYGNAEQGYKKYLSHSVLQGTFLTHDSISFRVISVRLDA